MSYCIDAHPRLSQSYSTPEWPSEFSLFCKMVSLQDFAQQKGTPLYFCMRTYYTQYMYIIYIQYIQL